MLKEIQNFARELGNSSKDKESSMLDSTIETYRSFGIENLPLLIEEVASNDNDKVTSILDNLGLGRKNSDVEKLEKLLSFSKSVVENEGILKDALAETTNYFTDKTITVKDAALLSMLEDLNTMSNYLVDLMLTLAFALGDQDYLEDKRAKKFFSLKSDFNMLFTIYYNNIDRKLKLINSASDSIVVEMTSKHSDKADGKLEVTMSGFNGNPIYHIRKGWVDIEMWRIRVLQDKKTLFGAKIIELRAMQNNENTKDISKQIDYYQNQIEKTEYKIHKLREV